MLYQRCVSLLKGPDGDSTHYKYMHIMAILIRFFKTNDLHLYQQFMNEIRCSWTTNRLYCGMPNTCNVSACIGQSQVMSEREQHWCTIEDVHCLFLWQLTLPETTAECHVSILLHWPLSFHWAGLQYRDYTITVKHVHLNEIQLAFNVI